MSSPNENPEKDTKNKDRTNAKHHKQDEVNSSKTEKNKKEDSK